MVLPLRAQSFCRALELTKPFKFFVSFVLHNGLGTHAGKVLMCQFRVRKQRPREHELVNQQIHDRTGAAISGY